MSVLSIEKRTNRNMVTSMVLSNRQPVLLRAFNIAAASFTLFMVLPILLTAAIAIKFTSEGPVLSKQSIADNDGTSVNIYKFNVTDATPVGRFISQTHVNELPQLLSVVKGEMSLIA